MEHPDEAKLREDIQRYGVAFIARADRSRVDPHRVFKSAAGTHLALLAGGELEVKEWKPPRARRGQRTHELRERVERDALQRRVQPENYDPTGFLEDVAERVAEEMQMVRAHNDTHHCGRCHTRILKDEDMVSFDGGEHWSHRTCVEDRL